MIKYYSTRGDKKYYTFSEVILKGIAYNGGLFVPERFPVIRLQELSKLSGKSYQEIALFIFKKFETDLSVQEITYALSQAYAHQFDDPVITPIKKLKDNQYFLELFHGPTLSFKDLSLQLLPRLMHIARKKLNINTRLLILTATSGDTGKAALEGFKNNEDNYLCVLYPQGKVSKLQERSMQTQEGKNVEIFAVKSNFDTCQKLIKTIFEDEQFNNDLLSRFNVTLTSANSINWGRIIAQTVYHAFAYFGLISQKQIKFGDPINIAIPTGNFGNALSALIAKKIGLPVQKIICASNQNNTVAQFISTGIYDIQKKFLVKTPSPAMDILIASNIERLLFLFIRDTQMVTQWMKDLKTKKYFTVDNQTKKLLQEHFYADWVSNESSLNNIDSVFKQTGYYMDPHTSVAQIVAESYIQHIKSYDQVPTIICATAHWAKFLEAPYNQNVPLIIKKWHTDPLIHTKTIEPNEVELKNKIIDYLS